MINARRRITTLPIAVVAKDAASLIGLSERTWWRLNTTGRTPRGFKVGKRRVWRVADLHAWADMGFPPREVFERHKPSTALDE